MQGQGFSPPHVSAGQRTYPASYLMCIRGIFSGEWPAFEADQIRLSVTEVKNAWILTFTSHTPAHIRCEVQ
jgi:hypothetical protein